MSSRRSGWRPANCREGCYEVIDALIGYQAADSSDVLPIFGETKLTPGRGRFQRLQQELPANGVGRNQDLLGRDSGGNNVGLHGLPQRHHQVRRAP